MRRRLPLLTLLVFLCGTWPAWSQRTEPDASRYYMGREIAATMHYTGAPWLVRESRQREEDCVTLMRELRVTAGQTVCDMGCGNGFYTVELAELVGEQGKVYAVDIQEKMLELSQRRAKTAELENIVFLHGTTTDPRLPENSLDLVLMVDVYHEFSHPEEMLRAISKSLKTTGQIALAEFRAEDPDVPIKPLHKMSKNQIFKEFRANGFRLVRQFDDLPWQHLMFFVREDSPVAATPTEVASPTAPDKTAPADTGQKAPLPNLKVRVLDKDGQPVARATVLVYDRNNYFAGLPVDFEQRSEMTGPEGWVDFGTMPQDYLCVQVQPREGEYFGSHSVIYQGEQGFVQTHPDRPAVRLETNEKSLCVTFTVRMGVDLKFEVTDAGTGETVFFPNIYYW
ncbi:MAG: class I SAM-dependent methyltransferase, partial [Planctomycetes bacterium]|nr:class I SAM-dependent methyltransferase [Planctomycetota bacterium]